MAAAPVFSCQVLAVLRRLRETDIPLRRARAVDVAAGQLIVREAGGVVAFIGCRDPLGAPLDVIGPVSPIVAARSEAGVRELARVPRW